MDPDHVEQCASVLFRELREFSPGSDSKSVSIIEVGIFCKTNIL
jgi:hypothetical protein